MQRCRVLIVDDQRDIRRMLRAALETLDAEISVTDVPSGEEAILVISRQRVDLLVSDVRLPGISGLELIERTRVRNPDLHLILITGMTDDSTRLQVEKAQADAFFYKPLEISEFLGAVQELLGIAGAGKKPLPEKPAPIEAALGGGPRQPAPPPVMPVPIRPLPGEATLGSDTVGPDRIEKPVQRILADARWRLNALLAALVDRQGELVDLDGEISADNDEWAKVLRISLGLTEPGTETPRAVIFVPGEIYDFWITPVAHERALVVGAAPHVWEQSAFGELVAALWSAAADVLTALSASVAAPPQDGLPVDESLLQSLDALFDDIQAHKLDSMDADAFWDLAAEDHSIPGEREGGITYDEARRLGLAPEED